MGSFQSQTGNSSRTTATNERIKKKLVIKNFKGNICKVFISYFDFQRTRIKMMLRWGTPILIVSLFFDRCYILFDIQVQTDQLVEIGLFFRIMFSLFLKIGKQ